MSVVTRLLTVVQHFAQDFSNIVVTTNTSFVDLGYDSLDMLELIMEIEDEFTIEIPDEDFVGRISTFEDLLKIPSIAKLLEAENAG